MSLVLLYIQYVHAEIVVYVVQIFLSLYLTLECMYCTYIYYFPHMFIIQNKKKEKLQAVRDL